jgi:hypothetical protein
MQQFFISSVRRAFSAQAPPPQPPFGRNGHLVLGVLCVDANTIRPPVTRSIGRTPRPHVAEIASRFVVDYPTAWAGDATLWPGKSPEHRPGQEKGDGVGPVRRPTFPDGPRAGDAQPSTPRAAGWRPARSTRALCRGSPAGRMLARCSTARCNRRRGRPRRWVPVPTGFAGPRSDRPRAGSSRSPYRSVNSWISGATGPS